MEASPRYQSAGRLTTTATTRTATPSLDEIERVVVGRRAALTLILTAVLARRHVLIERPARTWARPSSHVPSLPRSGLRLHAGASSPPDLLPADLLGSTIYDMQSGRFDFRHGPTFTHLLLADEINRTPPKTQAALLRRWRSGQVSIDGDTHTLPTPFIVLATDNPIEYKGAYPTAGGARTGPLPRNPPANSATSGSATTAMLRRRLDRGSAEPDREASCRRPRAPRDAGVIEQVTVHDDVLHYVVALAVATRHHPQVAVGASPRAELDLRPLRPRARPAAGRDT